MYFHSANVDSIQGWYCLKDYYYKKDGGGSKRSKRQQQQGQDRRPGKENHFDMRKLSKGDNKENPNQFK
jgi:hypothetical protein